ncbi:uncharacterized protein LOC131317723 [Rhododendron vialii]|uniref:uncharacterized protein LOC131317723 n=1 Tax=Rhododendron vialii TaxID=182163 RepID=UPI00265F70CE|nr:uncharacterized protein LOC131317723 [Rhododendron vialii]
MVILRLEHSGLRGAEEKPSGFLNSSFAVLSPSLTTTDKPSSLPLHSGQATLEHQCSPNFRQPTQLSRRVYHRADSVPDLHFSVYIFVYRVILKAEAEVELRSFLEGFWVCFLFTFPGFERKFIKY